MVGLPFLQVFHRAKVSRRYFLATKKLNMKRKGKAKLLERPRILRDRGRRGAAYYSRHQQKGSRGDHRKRGQSGERFFSQDWATFAREGENRERILFS